MAREGAITVSRWERNLGLFPLLYGARGAQGAVAAFELVHTSGGIDKFLLAGKKGMARGTDANFDVVAG